MRCSVLWISVAVVFGASAALADDKSQCEKGVAMIKAELAKKHPKSVVATLKKALDDADNETLENDWSECVTKIKPARAALRK